MNRLRFSTTMTSSDALCKNGNQGSATVATSGGTAPYAYLWNDALQQTGSTATNIPTNLYDVTVTDNNGCTQTNSISVSEPPAITIDSTIVNSNCNQSDGSACVIVSGEHLLTPIYGKMLLLLIVSLTSLLVPTALPFQTLISVKK